MSDSSPRPAIVTVALLLYYVHCIGSMFIGTNPDFTTLLVVGLLIALIVVTIHFCALGHNWARIVLAINGVIQLLFVLLWVFEVANAIRQGGQIDLAHDLGHLMIKPVAVPVLAIVASALLFVGQARTWFRGVKAHCVPRPSGRTITLTTAAVLLIMLAVGGFRYRQWTSPTLPVEVIVDVRNQLTEIRTEMARLDDLVAKLETEVALDAGGLVRDPEAKGNIKSLELTRAMLREGGITIYRDVRNRYPQLSERQRFEVASLIGNALKMNAQYYLLSDSVSDEQGGIIKDPGFDPDDTSQNLPDPKP